MSRRVRSGLLDSLRYAPGVVGFIGKCPVGRQVRLCSLGSLVCALGVVGFVWVRCVRLLGPWGSSGWFWFAGFIGVRPGGRRIVRGRWVLWGALMVSSGSLGVAGFIGVRPGARRVRSVLGSLECHRGRSGLLGSFRCTLGFVGFVRGR